MSWNDCLFWYAQERGGTYFGLRDGTEDGTLLLEDPKGPILLSAQYRSQSQYEVFWNISAAAVVPLERPYSLRIKAQSSLREGVNTVLEGLDRGARMLGRKSGLYRDYGAPEVADDRSIKTDEPEFTRWVLQSRELKVLLADHPDFEVQVGPMGPEGLDHLVSALVSLNDLPAVERDWLEDARWADLKTRYQQSGFREQLDALVELAKAARDAVTAWPMPMNPL